MLTPTLDQVLDLAHQLRARLAFDTLRALPHVQLIPLDDALIDAAASIAADYALHGADVTYVAVAPVQLYACLARLRAARACCRHCHDPHAG